MQPWLDLETAFAQLRDFSKVINIKIKRGKPFKSNGIKMIPDDTTLFPIRISTIEGMKTLYYYTDPFDEWSFVGDLNDPTPDRTAHSQDENRRIQDERKRFQADYDQRVLQQHQQQQRDQAARQLEIRRQMDERRRLELLRRIQH
jgi:hypothetical protein